MHHAARPFAVAGLIAVVAACGRASSPVHEALPPESATTAAISNGVCVTALSKSPEPPKSGADSVGVDGSPSGAVAYWLPALDQRPCISVRQQWTAAEAAEFVKRVRSTHVSDKKGSCPAGLGARTRVYLLYPGKSPELVDIDLTGCQSVTAPGRHAGTANARLLALLASQAPSSWKHYIP